MNLQREWKGEREVDLVDEKKTKKSEVHSQKVWIPTCLGEAMDLLPSNSPKAAQI